MDRMWSPWRSKHIDRMTQPQATPTEDVSVFTRLAREDDDEKNLILWRGHYVFVIMNRYPYNNGHLMIVPYREVPDYEDLTDAEREEIAHTTARCLRWLRAALHPEGFNVGMNLGAAAGAGIPEHLHVHILPRWHGDTNFMPVLGDVKVVPEALATTYTKLRRVIDDEHLSQNDL